MGDYFWILPPLADLECQGYHDRILRGNKAIMIKNKNGKRILIGIQKMMDAKAVIENQMREEKD